ncbi:cytochrome c oxidase subunit II [Caldovatus sp. SYSU G05006]|uniref:Cytochrome c oxidase subunit 2 n=2 Tax=Caldovatus aquaticus TaxID=2865671 RepID=A0ABS7F1U5_9PROT|nr:cytochrome c oxidase subunit II [Caldovatus aquaticus]
MGLVATGAALAQASSAGGAEPASGIGAPVPWGIGLQPSGGPVKAAIAELNTMVLAIIIAISIFVTLLLAWCIWRYRAKVNPTPSKTSHNTALEIAWTVIPVLILIVIAIPSFRLVYYQDRAREADLTVNVQGRQWYWHYEYPDHGNLAFDSRPVPADELKPGQIRNLSVDEPLVIPVGQTVRVLTTGQDVIHSFFVPSLGVQKYTIPGRTLETWFRADRPGVYYGQCNQICGTNHWFMPIEVHAVPEREFRAWLERARARAALGLPPGGAPGAAVAEGAPGAPTNRQTAEVRR